MSVQHLTNPDLDIKCKDLFTNDSVITGNISVESINTTGGSITCENLTSNDLFSGNDKTLNIDIATKIRVGGGTDIFSYEEFDETVMTTGTLYSPQLTINVSFRKIGNIAVITVEEKPLEDASTGSAPSAIVIYGLGGIPSAFRPANGLQMSVIVVENGIVQQGEIIMSPAGSLAILKEGNILFSNTINTGYQGFSFSYNV